MVCFCASSLIHSIATRVIKLAHAKSSLALAPALVETYSRLLVYMEIESLGIKGFISEFHLIEIHFNYSQCEESQTSGSGFAIISTVILYQLGCQFLKVASEYLPESVFKMRYSASIPRCSLTGVFCV